LPTFFRGKESRSGVGETPQEIKPGMGWNPILMFSKSDSTFTMIAQTNLD